jgi:hypothetical protein
MDENENEWPMLCSARPAFASLSERDIRTAIENDPECNNPVTQEVMRLGAEFLATFKLYVDQHGFEARGPNFPVRCPIEKVAIETIVAFVQAHASSWQTGKGH